MGRAQDISNELEGLKPVNDDIMVSRRSKSGSSNISRFRSAPINPGPILCLVDPPGVGKRLLESPSEATGRDFVRYRLAAFATRATSGHRRTYIGSMPGRIIQSFAKGEDGQPAFLLDEIDKWAWIIAATYPQRFSKCWIQHRTRRLTITIWKSTATFRRYVCDNGEQRRICFSRFSTGWRSSVFTTPRMRS